MLVNLWRSSPLLETNSLLVDDVRKIVDFLLSQVPLPSAWPRLASLLPNITRGMLAPAQVLLQSFIPHLDWRSIDSKKKVFQLSIMVHLLSGLFLEHVPC